VLAVVEAEFATIDVELASNMIGEVLAVPTPNEPSEWPCWLSYILSLRLTWPNPSGICRCGVGVSAARPHCNFPAKLLASICPQPGCDDFLVAKFCTSAAMTATRQSHDELWLQRGRLYRGNRACQQGSERICQCSEPVQGHFR
jgi:hypothetical protein